jgi:hypothetical protein
MLPMAQLVLLAQRGQLLALLQFANGYLREVKQVLPRSPLELGPQALPLPSLPLPSLLASELLLPLPVDLETSPSTYALLALQQLRMLNERTRQLLVT